MPSQRSEATRGQQNQGFGAIDLAPKISECISRLSQKAPSVVAAPCLPIFQGEHNFTLYLYKSIMPGRSVCVHPARVRRTRADPFGL